MCIGVACVCGAYDSPYIIPKVDQSRLRVCFLTLPYGETDNDPQAFEQELSAVLELEYCGHERAPIEILRSLLRRMEKSRGLQFVQVQAVCQLYGLLLEIIVDLVFLIVDGNST